MRSVKIDHRNSIGLEGKETPFMEGAYKVSCTLGPRKKAVTPEETGPDLAASTRGTLMEVGWGLVVTHCRGRDTGNSSSGQ